MRRANGDCAARRPLTGKCGIGGSLLAGPTDRPSVPLSQRRRPFPLFYYSVFFRDEGEDRVAGPFGIASATVERVKSDQVVLLCENGGELGESVCGRRRGRQTRITMSLARLLPFLLLVKSNVATSSVKIYMEKERGKLRSQSLSML